jgi:hypothetical protein
MDHITKLRGFEEDDISAAELAAIFQNTENCDKVDRENGLTLAVLTQVMKF